MFLIEQMDMFLIEHASLKICTSSVDGHLCCFHVLVIVNSAALNIGVHVSFRIMVFLGYVLWMDKEDVVHICGGILLSQEKQWIWVSSSEVDEARALWYRVKQVRKRKTNILSLYMKSRKMVLMNLFAGKEWRHRCRDRTCGHSRGRSERDKWRKQHQHVYAIVCKMDMGGKLLYNTGSPAWHSVMT